MLSDDEASIDRVTHKNLLSEINDIVKFQHIKRPRRSEPAIKNDEFHLVKTRRLEDADSAKRVGRDKKHVLIKSVANIVKKTQAQKKISNQFQDVFRKSKVLDKPLEKVEADRIQRTTGYESAKTKLSRWDAIITKNRSAEQLKFPLIQDKVKFHNPKNNDLEFSQIRYKSKMMKELEEIHNECFPKSKESNDAEPSFEFLTLEEMKERRKELARLKMRESNQVAKKRLQGKIKSKKYHRIKKKEEMKKKLKEFEELKITNPELALKELEKIEKERVRERASLRHKNTGTWAKNMKIRAQYDTTAKKELEAQLALGRELTQKEKQHESSESSEEDSEVQSSSIKTTDKNPWIIKNISGSNSLDEIFSGYKKFWDDNNTNKIAVKKLKEAIENSNELNSVNEKENDEDDNSSNEKSCDQMQESDDEDDPNFINNLFEEAEEKINLMADTKMKELKPKLLSSLDEKKDKRIKARGQQKKTYDPNDPRYLEFERKAQLRNIDEALIEGADLDETGKKEFMRPSKKILSEIKVMQKEKKAFMRGTTEEINPNSFLTIKSKHLITSLQQDQDFDEIDEDEFENMASTNKMSLAEAFENDDILTDFLKDNEEEIVKNQRPENGSLPGWGSWSWSGANIKNKSNKKKRRNQISEEKKIKDRVIINTKMNEKLKKHLVSAVPFPFKTIKDYQASLRFPIGRDFVPASAHNKLTESSVTTRAGTIIEPMTEDVLVNNQEQIKRKNKKNKHHMKNKNRKKKLYM